jgi:NADPH-dependent FMN reductase
MPKLLAVYGSPRRNGNTSVLLQNAVAGARDAGACVEEIWLNKLKMSPCLEIYGCKKDGRCVIKDDFQAIYDQISSCDGIMIASPIFFYAVSAQVKILMDRCQSFWVKKYWITNPPNGQAKLRRKGLVISVGASTRKNLFDGLTLSMKAFFDAIDTELTEQLLYTGLDLEGDILKHPDYLAEAYETGKIFCNKFQTAQS